MNLNKILVCGRLTREPELKALPNGNHVASFSLAIGRTFKNKDGQKEEQTEYVPVVVFGKSAESCSQYLTKGQVAMVEGRLQTRTWEAEGEKRYRTEVIAERVQFGAKPQGSGTVDDKGKGMPVKVEYPVEDINPDDIPF